MHPGQLRDIPDCRPISHELRLLRMAIDCQFLPPMS
jgi:hypothetical protein